MERLPSTTWTHSVIIWVRVQARPMWVIAMKCLVKDDDDSRKSLTNWMPPKVESHERCVWGDVAYSGFGWDQVKDTPTIMTSSPWLWTGQNHQDNWWSFGTENMLHKNNFLAMKRGQGNGHFWQTPIYQRGVGRGDMIDFASKSKSRSLSWQEE